MANLSQADGARIVKLMIAGMLAFLLLVGYVFFQAYQGRTALVDSQRAGCGRGKLDRAANASGWRSAQAARLRSVAVTMHISFDAAKQVLRQAPSPDDLSDLTTARKYDKIATGLEKRARIDCAKVYPKAGLFP